MEEIKIGLDTTKCYGTIVSSDTVVGYWSGKPVTYGEMFPLWNIEKPETNENFPNSNKSENKTMSRNTANKTNTVATATYHNVRDSKGRFAPRRIVQAVKSGPIRDAKGRFVSVNAPVTPTPTVVKSGRTAQPVTRVPANPNDLLQGAKSSFLDSMMVEGDYIVVKMQGRTKTEYVYNATLQNVTALRNARKNNRSMGSAYNAVLKGREICVREWC